MAQEADKADERADAVAQALRYHERTKHHFRRYARSLGYLDWATQPNPFRRYEGAPRLPLEHPPPSDEPAYQALFGAALPAAALNSSTLSQLFYDSLAISAWKQYGGGEPWSLRVNPSSGDLHPTEAYLLCGGIEGVGEASAVYHYCVYEHALERRAELTPPEWSALIGQLPPGAVLVALTSVCWRESWKYGERAYRYCHHDVGHAIGAIALSAAVLGWQTRLVGGVSDEALAVLAGVHTQHGPEAEHPDCLLALFPAAAVAPATVTLRAPGALIDRLRGAAWQGRPNRLSVQHHSWPAIDEVSGACRYDGQPYDVAGPAAVAARCTPLTDRRVSARGIIRRRRSALGMDAATRLDREGFYLTMRRMTPACSPFPYDVLPWPPLLSLALFVHRVEGLPAGLYLLLRHPDHEDTLRSSIRGEFRWECPEGCPEGLRLHRLLAGDAREAARAISCHQDIAADGVYSLGMLAFFEPLLRGSGAWMYPRLFWEAGLIGQVLYLEAEAAGLRGTGIGCFFDDPMHEVLGLQGRAWQDLYHFSTGGAVEDPRLVTLPSYAHLGGRSPDEAA